MNSLFCQVRLNKAFWFFKSPLQIVFENSCFTRHIFNNAFMKHGLTTWKMLAKDYAFVQVAGSFISTLNTIKWQTNCKDFDKDFLFTELCSTRLLQTLPWSSTPDRKITFCFFFKTTRNRFSKNFSLRYQKKHAEWKAVGETG